jgi:hypothetical protein
MPALPASQRPTLVTTRLVFVCVLVATAIPGDLGPPSFGWGRWNSADVLANLLLYIPLGLVLGARTSEARTFLIAAGLSTAIEIAQLFYANRVAHPLDVACNVFSALLGRRLAGTRHLLPTRVALSRNFGVVVMAVAALWILSSRVFRMYLGGYGWFAHAVPGFWPFVPRWAIDAGVEIHALGLLANTAIAGLLAAAAAIGLVQARHPFVQMAAGALSGFLVGNMMTPHYELFPVGPALMGTVAGVAFAVCCASEPAYTPDGTK